MGIVNFGIPEKESEFLRNNLNLNVFVEGGTYRGRTAKKMSGKFSKVYTIEKADVLFEIASKTLGTINNVTLLKGDTRDHLDNILENNNHILFWLDAHWSGGETYGEFDECPLIEELAIIFKYSKNYIILIDDARLFLAPPPLPHIINNWPSLNDISKILPPNWDMLVFEDVIYLFPDQGSKYIKTYFQDITTDKWNARKPSFINRLKLLRGKIC